MDTTPVLTIYSLGFFLYPYRTSGGNTTAPCIAAPQCSGHTTWVVVCTLAKPLECTPFQEIKTPTTVRIETEVQGGQFAHLETPAEVKRDKLINGLPSDPDRAKETRQRVRPTQEEGVWANFELIPDVRHMTDKATLRPGWEKDTMFSLGCIGGDLTSVPDQFTLGRRWRWEGGHRQVVSALGRYRVPGFEQGRICVGDKTQKLTNQSVVILLNISTHQSETALQRYQRGLAHHVAIMGLCEAETRVTLENPLDHEKIDVENVEPTDYETYVKHGRDLVYASLGLKTSETPREAGYPSCNGRKIAV